VHSPYEGHEKQDTLSAWVNKYYYNKLASRPIGCRRLWQAYRSKQLFQGHLEKLILFHCYAQKYFSLQNGDPGHKVSFGIIFIKIFLESCFLQIL